VAQRYTNEELRELANLRGIKAHIGLTHRDLLGLLDPTPPTEEQLALIRRFAAGEFDPTLVDASTFGKARMVIGTLEDARNSATNNETGWRANTVLLWNSAYYLVLKVFSNSAWHRLDIQALKVIPPTQPDGEITLTPTGSAHSESSFLMKQDGAEAVTLKVVKRR
jgi:hypothetical protein